MARAVATLCLLSVFHAASQTPPAPPPVPPPPPPVMLDKVEVPPTIPASTDTEDLAHPPPVVKASATTMTPPPPPPPPPVAKAPVIAPVVPPVPKAKVPAPPPPPVADADISLALAKAASVGDAVEAAALIARGADVNIKQNDGWTPLHLVMIAAYNKKIDDPIPYTEVLLKARADVDILDGRGRTALFFAAITGKKAVVELFKHAKELTDKKHAPASSLGKASYEGHTEAVEAILAMGHHADDGHSFGGMQQANVRELMKHVNKDRLTPEVKKYVSHPEL